MIRVSEVVDVGGVDDGGAFTGGVVAAAAARRGKARISGMLRKNRSSGERMRIPHPGAPARAVRPRRWIYWSLDAGRLTCMMSVTLNISTTGVSTMYSLKKKRRTQENPSPSQPHHYSRALHSLLS